MTTFRPSADLTIPDAALRRLHEAFGDSNYVYGHAEDAVRRIARPVVAQFLRDLASQHLRVTGGFLAELADGLDGGEPDE